MARSLELLPGAVGDVEGATDWYAQRSPAAALRFLDSLGQVLREIAGHPMRYPQSFSDIRGAMVPRFPYRAFYRVRPEEIQVVAVAHTSRLPGYWRNRVS